MKKILLTLMSISCIYFFAQTQDYQLIPDHPGIFKLIY